MNYEGNGAPFLDIGSLKGLKLRRLVQAFALSDDELMERVLVHQLIVPSFITKTNNEQ